MKTIDEIRDMVAMEMGLTNYEGFLVYIAQYSGSFLCDTTTDFVNQVAKRYAEESIREAAEKAHILYEYMPVSDVHIPTREVDKNSILNLINELQ